MTVTPEALAQAVGSPAFGQGVRWVLGLEAHSEAYDEPHQVVFSALVVLARKYMEISGDHPGELLSALGENLDVAVKDGLDLLSQQDEAYADARREEEPEEPRITIAEPPSGFFNPVNRLAEPLAEMTRDTVIEHMANHGFGPEDDVIQGLIELGVALGLRHKEEAAAIERVRYTCRSCNEDFGLELPFPENSPIHGDDGSGEGCNDGLIVKTTFNENGDPESEEPLPFYVVISTVNGTTSALAYFVEQDAMDAITECIEAHGELSLEAILYRKVPNVTAKAVHNAENFLTETLKSLLPVGVRVLVVQ